MSLTTRKASSIILIIGIVAFFNSIFNNFVGDDIPQLTENLRVQALENIPSFFTGSTFYYGNNQKLTGVYYKPLMSTIFSLIYSFFGLNYYVYHIFLILLHIVSVYILYLVLKHFFRQGISLLLSLIFLIHPINSEAVFYISAMQDILFFLFGIISLWTLIQFKSKKYLILTISFLFLSLLSKETGILFLCVSILYTLIFSKKQLYPLFIGSLLFLTVYAFLRINAVGIFTNPESVPIQHLNLLQRSFNIPSIIFFYVKQFFFPVNLAVSYDWVYKQINFSHFFLPMIFDILLLSSVFIFAYVLYKHFSRSHFKTYIFFVFWTILGIIFHLQIFPLDATVAERWLYFPIVGFLGMIGVLLEVFHFNLRSKWSILFISILLISLLTRTIIRSFDWRDDISLSTHDITISPSAYNLENRLSELFIQQGQLQQAKLYAEKSIKIYPNEINYKNLGVVYARLGNYQKAKEVYLKGLTFGDYYLLYENLAGLGLVTGNTKDNIHFIEKSLKKYPQDARLWLYLAILQYKTKDIGNAKSSITQAYSYDQSAPISNVYEAIMNNQPLNLQITTK